MRALLSGVLQRAKYAQRLPLTKRVEPDWPNREILCDDVYVRTAGDNFVNQVRESTRVAAKYARLCVHSVRPYVECGDACPRFAGVDADNLHAAFLSFGSFTGTFSCQ